MPVKLKQNRMVETIQILTKKKKKKTKTKKKTGCLSIIFLTKR